MNLFKRVSYTDLDSAESGKFPSSNGSKYYSAKKLIIGVTTLCVGLLVVTFVLSGGSATKEESPSASGQLTATATSPGPQVQIDLGTLEGKTLVSRGGRNYSAFYNIPYAKPAVGELRFEPPQEYTEAWEGVRDATQRGNKCIQNRKGMTEIQGSEDCFYLNVYTPKLPGRRRRQRNLLPTMFYMFGGGFKGGEASNYGGDYFMDKDVVIVLAEWRLGVMGFLSTGDENIAGNMGFKDQVMALTWVKKNIKKFGGNPDLVTLFGNSAGSMSTHAHLLSNMSRGLYHRAISQSGVALTSPNGILLTDPREKTREVAAKVGCQNLDDTKELTKCLKNASAAEILNAQGTRLFSLTVEAIPENGDTSNTFLSDTPLRIMQEGRMNPDVPWIIGVNDGEKNLNAVVFNDTETAAYYNSNWETVGPEVLDYVDDANHTTSKRIREFYFGDKEIGEETRLNYSTAISDREFTHPSMASANLHASFANTSPVYLYWLSKVPKESVGDPLKEVFDPPYGVAHSDEVQYLFLYLNDKFEFIGEDSQDYNMSLLMVDIWTTFAKTGVPPYDWTPVPKGHTDKDSDLVWFNLNTDEEVKMIEPEGVKERVQFWDTFPLNYLYVENVTTYS